MKKFNKKSGQTKKAESEEKPKKSVLLSVREANERANQHFERLFVKRWKNLRSVRLWILEWGLLSLVVFLLAIVQLYWYDDAYKSTTYVNGGDYSEATLGEVKSMNPLYAASSSEKTLAKLLFANLMSPDTTGHMKGELAESVKRVDGDAAKWVLKLRENLRWSDGEPITADDVIYTIGLLSDKSAKTTIATDFSSVDLVKIDNKTVEFDLPSPYIDFTDSLEFPIVPKHILGDIEPALVYESSFSKNPVGSGVFKFNAVQTENAKSKAIQTIYLNKNEQYYLSGTRLSSFTLKTYDSVADIREAFEMSEVTATAELDQNEHFSREQVAERDSSLNAGVFMFFNTTSRNAVGDVKVRKAIRKGIDMAAVRGDEFAKRGLDYSILQAQIEDLAFPEIEGYNLSDARKELADAGYEFKEGILSKDGQPQTIRLVLRGGSEQKLVAERIEQQLIQLGFEVNVTIYEDMPMAPGGGDFYSNYIQPRNFDILLYEVNLGVSADPFVYYNSKQATEHGWNLSNYNNKLADDALLSARTTNDFDLRKMKYESFLGYWVEDVPSIGVYRSSLSYYYMDGAQIYSEDVTMTDALDRFADVRNFATQKGRVNLTP